MRYQLSNALTSGYTTVYTTVTSVTLNKLEPEAHYSVSVAAINSNDEMSKYSDWVTAMTAVTATTAMTATTAVTVTTAMTSPAQGERDIVVFCNHFV